MLTEGSGYRNRRGRDISFSKPFDNYCSRSGSKQDSPSIAVESVTELYREKNRNFSPLHNLHYKYLPHNYISPEKKDKKYHQKDINEQSEAINSKIKNLLSSIDQEEKNKQLYNQKYYNKTDYENVSRYSHNYYENTPKGYKNANDSVYLKPSIQKTVQQGQRYTTPLRDKNSVNKVLRQKQQSISSIKQSHSNTAHYKENLLPPKSTNLKTMGPDKQQTFHSSSYSNLNSRYQEYSASRIKRQKQNDQNYAILETNKDVDNQIAKLQRKIQQLQQMKAEVCSDFNQQRHKMKSIDQITVPAISNVSQKANLQSSNNSSMHKPRGQVEPKVIQQQSNFQKRRRDDSGNKNNNFLYQKLSNYEHKKENRLDEIASFKSSMFSSMLDTKSPVQLTKNTQSHLQENESQYIKSLEQSGTKSHLYAQNSKVSNEDIGVPKILQKLATKRKKAQNKIQKSNVVVPHSSESSVSQFLNTNTQTPMSIETRRQYINQIKAKDLNNAVSSLSQFQAKSEISRLLSNFKNQILIDQDLRKVKKWFLRNRNQYKWRDLQVLLRKNHLYFDDKTMRITFSIASEEDNPFYEPKQNQYTLQHLVSQYERAQKHWAENIVKNYSKQKLQKAAFTQQSIDIAKKGSISIEDLVRYINFELDAYYRNRDIYVIFHRLKKTQELRFIDILKCLAHY